MTNESAKPKALVAVHGIGDQHQYETVQSVAYCLCRYYGQPTAIPFGRFHFNTAPGMNPRVMVLKSPPDPEVPGTLGFAEVHWANIPRELVKEGYTLEESKKWAQTIVERLRIKWDGVRPVLRPDECAQVQTVLGELIESVAVLERLTFLAEKAGLFKFKLRQVLEDYLNDVQVVTEFGKYREKILQEFYKVMREVAQWQPDLEIYIIAHSEGTVIAFLGLLQAMCEQPSADWQWVQQVRGFMTIGSPLDKHLILWPELWGNFTHWQWHPSPDKPRIQWRNYYDRADPIGFDLNKIRQWLGKTECPAFEFEEDHDYGFSRYTLPGKAHIDYWQDPAVFGHFLHTVVQPVALQDNTPSTDSFTEPPQDKKWAQAASYILPYGLVFALLFGATFFFFKAVFGWVYGGTEWASFCTDVFGITLLLGGITVLARIPHLTRARSWHAVSVLLFLLSVGGFYEIVSSTVSTVIGEPVSLVSHRLIPPSIAPFVLAVVLCLAVYLVCVRFPRLGVKPLVAIGCLVSFGITLCFIIQISTWNDTLWQDMLTRPVWPVLLAAAVFLYLWWVAALVFDLTFVWHRYVRRESLVERLYNRAEPASNQRGKQAA
ncbi:MAG: MFS transporter [Deltaproteobacteria bacterium]|nr:MFS transporter [Deltaproteobacteria bacterium]